MSNFSSYFEKIFREIDNFETLQYKNIGYLYLVMLQIPFVNVTNTVFVTLTNITCNINKRYLKYRLLMLQIMFVNVTNTVC